MVSTYIGSSKFNKNMTFDSISCGDFKMHNYPHVTVVEVCSVSIWNFLALKSFINNNIY